MRRLATTFLVLLGGLSLLAMRPAPSQAQTILFDYVGFDYESPNPDTLQFGEPGSGYVGLGVVPGVFLPLIADTTAFQYTYVMSGLVPVSTVVIGDFLIVNYSPGTLTLYEDSKSLGTAADYGINPPNATAPPSFTDGSTFLIGTLTGFQFVLNTTNGSGSYEGKLSFIGGDHFGDLPSDRTTGWTFAGATGNALNIPPGYEHQIDGQSFLDKPTAVTHSSWGQLKAKYR